MNLFSLKLTAAVVLNGKIRTAGAIVEVDRATAENLLQRGRAEVATEADEVQEVAGDGAGQALPDSDGTNAEKVAPAETTAAAEATAEEATAQAAGADAAQEGVTVATVEDAPAAPAPAARRKKAK